MIHKPTLGCPNRPQAPKLMRHLHFQGKAVSCLDFCLWVCALLPPSRQQDPHQRRQAGAWMPILPARPDLVGTLHCNQRFSSHRQKLTSFNLASTALNTPSGQGPFKIQLEEQELPSPIRLAQCLEHSRVSILSLPNGKPGSPTPQGSALTTRLAYWDGGVPAVSPIGAFPLW